MKLKDLVRVLSLSKEEKYLLAIYDQSVVKNEFAIMVQNGEFSIVGSNMYKLEYLESKYEEYKDTNIEYVRFENYTGTDTIIVDIYLY